MTKETILLFWLKVPNPIRGESSKGHFQVGSLAGAAHLLYYNTGVLR